MTEAHVDSVLVRLRASVDGARSEADIQGFLERHPYLVSLGRVPAYHMVVSQFPLGSEFRADFAYLELLNSGTILHLVEIEGPRLLMFNADDEFSQAFNHACQQLEDWTDWCDRNRSYVADIVDPMFPNSAGELRHRAVYFRAAATLVAGRRSELTTARRRRRYAAKANAMNRALSIMTYDDFFDSLPEHLSSPGNYYTSVRCVRYRQQSYS